MISTLDILLPTKAELFPCLIMLPIEPADYLNY